MLRMLFALCLLLNAVYAANVKVASLHPILSDLAKSIGAQHVDVIDLMPAMGDLHRFQATPQDIARSQGAQFILASGKDLEPYLKRLQDSIPASMKILDIGADVPDVAVTPAEGAELACDHEHGDDAGCSHGPNDPHWWHTPAHMKRAARTLCKALSGADPANAKEYQENLKVWNKKMDDLHAWALAELAPIPQNRRVIVTGHSAMNHFCSLYHFKPMSVQGIAKEDEGTALQLASIMKELRSKGTPCIFLETTSNPKMLEEIARQLQQPVGLLITDGLTPERHGFEWIFRHNVAEIKKLLSPQP